MIVDTHAHYDDRQFDADRDILLAGLAEKNVGTVINAGADLESCRDTLSLTEKYKFIYGMAGIHPHAVMSIPADWEARLIPFFEHEKIVAVGEIGLDYHYLDEREPERHKVAQKQVFCRQIELALKRGLPICVHDREAHGDVLEILQKYKPEGVVHCFSGSVEMAREIVRLGMYVGIGGAVTFKNARHPVQVAAEIPIERILLETDAPYMTPVPFRGKRNDSSMLTLVAEKIAQLRGMSVGEIVKITARNAEELFGISG